MVRKYYDTIFAFLCSLLFVYVLLRSHFLNITHDEAHSYHSIKNFWYVQFLCTGNSHWLNSLAIKISLLFGFENVLGIRWLSLISFAGVLICAFIWIRSIEKPYLKLSAFCFLFLSPYLIDYFGLARGYASAIMFQALSISFYIAGLNKGKRNYLFFSLVCSGLSAIANFGFVYFFMAFSLIYFYEIHFQSGFIFLKKRRFYIDVFMSIAFSLVLLRAFVFIIQCSKDLVGAGTYTIGEMFRVFIDGQAYHKFEFIPAHLQIYALIFLTLVIAACIFGVFKIKNQSSENSDTIIYSFCSALFLIMICVILFNFFCFGIVLPFYRTMLVFFIPVSVVLFYFVEHAFKNKTVKKLIFTSISGCLIINFCYSMNLKYCFDFKEQADSREGFNWLANTAAKRVGISPELYGVYSNYYRICKDYPYTFMGEMIETRFPKGICSQKNKLSEFDHLIIFPPYDMSYYKNSNIKVKVLKYYETTGTVIVKVIR